MGFDRQKLIEMYQNGKLKKSQLYAALTPNERGAMEYLSKHPHATGADVATKLGVAESNTLALLRRLYEWGLVERAGGSGYTWSLK